MADIAPRPTKTTRRERALYRSEVGDEAWELSREQFQVHHGLIVAAIGLVLRWGIRGWDEMVNELLTSLLYIATPVVLYLVGLYVFNYGRARLRVPIHYQREIARLTEEAQTKLDSAQIRKIERLQYHISRGEVVVTQSRAKDRKVSFGELVTRWEADVKTYLQNFFDDDHVRKFLDSANIPIDPQVAEGVREEEKPTYIVLCSRIIWLQQLLGEVEKNAPRQVFHTKQLSPFH